MGRHTRPPNGTFNFAQNKHCWLTGFVYFRCKQLVEKRLDCKHVMQVPCHKSRSTHVCMAATTAAHIYSCGKHSITPGVCHDLTDLQRTNPPCPQKVACLRLRCGHSAEIECHEAATHHITTMEKPDTKAGLEQVHMNGKYLPEAKVFQACMQHVQFINICGHATEVTCSRAFEWITQNSSSKLHKLPPCEAKVSPLSPLCGHTLNIPCRYLSHLQAWKPFPMSLSPASKLQKVVNAQEPIPIAPPSVGDIKLNLLDIFCCKEKFLLKRECGHSIELKCLSAFGLLPRPPCTVRILI